MIIHLIQPDPDNEAEDKQILGTLSAMANDVLACQKVLVGFKHTRHKYTCSRISSLIVRLFDRLQKSGFATEWKELENEQVRLLKCLIITYFFVTEAAYCPS